MSRQLLSSTVLSRFARSATVLVTVATAVAIAVPSWAASIFLTGHDPDFHSIRGGNTAGARNINNTALDFVMDASANTFVGNGINQFLFVESRIAPPAGHVNGVNGMIASGYTLGVDFEHHDASTLAGELALLGTKYSAIVVASDFGGVLTQAELDILNDNSSTIIDFLNAGGGLYAMAEGNSGRQLTPDGGHFGFLPFVVSSQALNQSEQGVTVTPFGASLGLTNNDVNGNASHTIFQDTFGLEIVDVDANGNILTLAGRGTVDQGGVKDVPEPSALMGLLGLGVLGAACLSKSQRRR